MLPYILSEIRDLSAEEPRRRAAPRYEPRYEHGDDIANLLNELLVYRPPARGPCGVLRLVDAPEPRTLRRRQSHPGRPTILQQLKKELGELARPDDSAFAVNVDVQDYRPEELSVQVTKDDGYVVVEGSHEERADEHGLVRRQFTRRYKLPDGVDPDTITSKLTADGVLQVSAQPLPALSGRVRQVPITCSKEPALQAHAEEKQAEAEEDTPAQNES